MDNDKDIHNYAACVAAYVEKIRTDSALCKQNQQALLDYSKSLHGLATGTQSKNLQVMLRIAKLLGKPFKQATRKDIEGIVDNLRENGSLTNWTVQKYLICIKRFYRWLYGMKKHRFPKQVDWIEVRKARANGVPMNRLSLEDYKAMIQAAPTPKSKFIIAVLADSGARIGEIGSMNIENVEDRGDYLMLSISESKTQVRSIPVKNSRPYLLDYLKVHPKPVPGQPLLMDNKGNRMRYENIRAILIRAKRAAGISKPINPHHFRRSTATIYGQFFHENEIDAWFGWGTQKTSNIYVQFSGKQLLEAYSRFWESDKNILRQVVCPTCSKVNAGTMQYCEDCQQPLLQKTVLQAGQQKRDLLLETLTRAFNNPVEKKKVVEFLANLASETGTAKAMIQAQ